MEAKKSSLPHQNPKLARERAFFPRANRGLEPREKDKASKCYQQKAFSRGIDGRPLFPPKSSGYVQKPWPTKASAGAEELVKHMSNVPGYLQRAEKGDNLQEKALNVGVLDWRCLEKWTGGHRQVTVDEKAAISPASSNASSSFSMFGSSSQSCRSSGSSYVAHRNQSPSLNRSRNFSTEEDYKQISAEEASRNSMGCHRPEITHRRCPVKHRISGSAEQYLNMDNYAAKLEESKQNSSEFHAFSDIGSSLGANFLPPRSEECATTNSMNRKMKPLDVVSDCREKRSGELGCECPNTSVCADDDCPNDNHSGFSQLDDGTLGHFQKSIQSSRRFSFKSTEPGYVKQIEPAFRSSLGASHSENFQFAAFSPNITHSCRFPYDSQSNQSDENICKGSEVACDSTNSSPHLAAVATVRSNGCQERHDKSANWHHNNSAAKMSKKWEWNGLKLVTPTGRESLPNNHSNASASGMIRSSSLTESSATGQPKLASLDRHNGDKVTDSNRGRRSPLRRLLDPLMKPKAFYRTSPARLAAGSTRQPSCEGKLPIQEELTPTHGLNSSYIASTNTSGDGACEKGSTSASWVPLENHGPVHEKHETSTKQALLRLAWKNGLPLLTFSVNESDILAATRRKGTSVKQDCDCIYTFHYVHEIKKKTGGWISQGDKGKRKELVSRVVGQMNVSCLRCPRNHIAVREFVLFGPELRPTAHETLEPVPNSELAAMVVRVPEEDVESSIGNMPQKNNHQDQSKTKLVRDKNVFQPVEGSESGQNLQENDQTIVAILPSEVHSLSDGGKPSPLVERWKSGGLCDCGGWDVGCSLSILTNRLRASGSGLVQSCHTTDGTHRVELFLQGGGQESRPVFSLVAFKEELYTVHFHASITVLQAFAVCVAILHSKKQTGLNELQDPQRCTPMEASPVKDPARKQVEPSSMSVPYHPPLSPVGRA